MLEVSTRYRVNPASCFQSACGVLYTQPIFRHLSLICRSAYPVVLIVQLISEIGREGRYVVANTALFNFPDARADGRARQRLRVTYAASRNRDLYLRTRAASGQAPSR